MNTPTTDGGTAKPDPTRLVIRRTFRAPIERVFRALTEPEAIRGWFGPAGVECTAAQSELRVGGAWSIAMQSPDGETHEVSGEFLEVDAPGRVVFTWVWRSMPERVSRVTYALRPEGDGATMLTLTHERFHDKATRDRHGEGWSGSLDKLATWLGESETQAEEQR